MVNQNKKIRIWYQYLAYANNTRVVQVSKLVDGINLDLYQLKYNPKEMLIYLDSSDNKSTSNKSELPRSRPTKLRKPAKLEITEMVN